MGRVIPGKLALRCIRVSWTRPWVKKMANGTPPRLCFCSCRFLVPILTLLDGGLYNVEVGVKLPFVLQVAFVHGGFCSNKNHEMLLLDKKRIQITRTDSYMKSSQGKLRSQNVQKVVYNKYLPSRLRVLLALLYRDTGLTVAHTTRVLALSDEPVTMHLNVHRCVPLSEDLSLHSK